MIQTFIVSSTVVVVGVVRFACGIEFYVSCDS